MHPAALQANKIVDAYEAQGLESLKDQRHGHRGAPTLLSDADLLLLAQTIRADVAEGGCLEREPRSGVGQDHTPERPVSGPVL